MQCSDQRDGEGKTGIRLCVAGWPPKKSEALSLFNRDHGDRLSVVELLKAAGQALDKSQWNPSETRPIGLELVITAETPEAIPGDAMNYLGGVADVLQAKRIGADLSHLGDLAQASLYHDDRQIREVRYTVELGDAARYHVHVWAM